MDIFWNNTLYSERRTLFFIFLSSTGVSITFLAGGCPAGFHRQAKGRRNNLNWTFLLENFPLDCQTRQTKSSSQSVNLPSAWHLRLLYMSTSWMPMRVSSALNVTFTRARAGWGLSWLSFSYQLRMGKNTKPQKEWRSNEPASDGPVFTWRNLNPSSQVNPSLKKGYMARGTDPAWLLFSCKLLIYLTAEGLPTMVIQPRLKSNPGLCKEALNETPASILLFIINKTSWLKTF